MEDNMIKRWLRGALGVTALDTAFSALLDGLAQRGMPEILVTLTERLDALEAENRSIRNALDCAEAEITALRTELDDLDVEDTVNDAIRNHEREMHEDDSWVREIVREELPNADEIVNDAVAAAMEAFATMASQPDEDFDPDSRAMAAMDGITSYLDAHGYGPQPTPTIVP